MAKTDSERRQELAYLVGYAQGTLKGIIDALAHGDVDDARRFAEVGLARLEEN